jgi:glycerol-3-phosphate O-acyltransferase
VSRCRCATCRAPGGETTTDADVRKLALQKTAFEVAWRINKATPVTPVALVTTLLLGTRGMGLTTSQVTTALGGVLDFFESRGVSIVSSAANLRTEEGVRQTLGALSGTGGIVTRVEGARSEVWLIEPKNQLAATFYRNSIIHVFLVSALCEIALVLALRTAQGDARVTAFWTWAERLRDLLKFEFYFKDRADFRAAMALEVARGGADWGSNSATRVLPLVRCSRSASMTASFHDPALHRGLPHRRGCPVARAAH